MKVTKEVVYKIYDQDEQAREEKAKEMQRDLYQNYDSVQMYTSVGEIRLVCEEKFQCECCGEKAKKVIRDETVVYDIVDDTNFSTREDIVTSNEKFYCKECYNKL